jgi:hypothetical protein
LPLRSPEHSTKTSGSRNEGRQAEDETINQQRKERKMNACKNVLGTLAVAISLAAASPARAADDSHESLRELTAQWWQWALSIPAAVNPLADTTGEFCMVGQRGPIWFLAGFFGSSVPVQRTCSVPEGVPLFFPVINTVWINTPVCDGLVLSVAELRAKAAADIDGATGLSVLLNNRPVGPLRRVRSEVFYTAFPRGNLFGADCLFSTPQSPSVDDGYYLKLKGLREGQHHLSIRGTSAGGFSVDAFYTLNVVKTALRDPR